MTSTQTVEIRRAADRAATKISWLDSKHSFSFGSALRPRRTRTTACCSSTTTTGSKPGTGFDTHPHRDMEIVTWVLRGSLVHQDSTGPLRRHLSGPGPTDVGRPRHPALREERLLDAHRRPNPRRARPLRPDVGGPRRVRYQPGLPATRDRRRTACAAAWCTIASGMPEHADDAAITIRQPLCRSARRASATRRQRRASRGALPAPVRAARRGHPRRCRRRCTKATPFGSRHPAGNGSPRPNPSEILVWEMHAGLAAA